MTVILYPPERFDVNEWFTIISVVLIMTIAILLPRRFSLIQKTIIVVFTVFISQSVDSMIAVKPYDLYDVSDSPKYEIMDLVIYYVCFPPVGYLFLYLYDRWRLKGWRLGLYIVGFSLLSTFLEWLAVIFHVYTFKGWKNWYSPFVYIVVYILYVVLFHKVLNPLKKRETAPSN